MKLREKLIEKIKQQGDPNNLDMPSPVVGLEDFFYGNKDLGSIGCNLYKHPGLESFYELLKLIREKAIVQDVLVEIYEIYEEDETVWPYSERIYIITSAQKNEVEKWIAELQYDEINEGWAYGKPKGAPDPLKGYTVYNIWWD